MTRHEITPQQLEEILTLFSRIIFSDEWLSTVQESTEAFPLITALLNTQSPSTLIDSIRNGWFNDLERVGGLAWKWNISEDRNGSLQIVFYMNLPAKEKTKQDQYLENLINAQVAKYLADI